MLKSFSIKLINGINKLQVNDELEGIFLVDKDLTDFLEPTIDFDLVILVAALWSGPDVLMIERGVEVMRYESSVKFGIKGYDKKEELDSFVKMEGVDFLSTPYWMYIKSGKVIHRDVGKIMTIEGLKARIKELEMGL